MAIGISFKRPYTLTSILRCRFVPLSPRKWTLGFMERPSIQDQHGSLFKRHNPGLCSLPFQRPQYVNIVLLTGTEDDLGYKDYLLGLCLTAGKSVVPYNGMR